MCDTSTPPFTHVHTHIHKYTKINAIKHKKYCIEKGESYTERCIFNRLEYLSPWKWSGVVENTNDNF